MDYKTWQQFDSPTLHTDESIAFASNWGTCRSHLERLQDRYRNGGEIADLLDDISSIPMPEDLPSRVTANIYSFLQACLHFPELRQITDEIAAEELDTLLDELHQQFSPDRTT